MKIFNRIFAGALAVAFVAGCNDGIDPISSVPQGNDETAPVVVIKTPSIPKTIIPFTDVETDMNFEFEVQDDVEVSSIVLSLNGTQLETYKDFTDYRRVPRVFPYANLPIGQHTIQVTATDISGKSTTQSFPFEISNIYEPLYEGEIFYMPFEDSYMDLIGKNTATSVGTPGFTTGKVGKAYVGTTDEYLSFPTTGLLHDEFSATFWYNVNATPDRAGILTIGPPDPVLPATPNNRTSGFRFFREGDASNQNFSLNVGTGATDAWFNGSDMKLNPTSAGWVHIAFTISDTQCVVYFNGQIVKQGPFEGVSWAGCDILSIASGVPRFTEWGHKSDSSPIDELRFYNKELTPDEVRLIMGE